MIALSRPSLPGRTPPPFVIFSFLFSFFFLLFCLRCKRQTYRASLSPWPWATPPSSQASIASIDRSVPSAPTRVTHAPPLLLSCSCGISMTSSILYPPFFDLHRWYLVSTFLTMKNSIFDCN